MTRSPSHLLAASFVITYATACTPGTKGGAPETGSGINGASNDEGSWGASIYRSPRGCEYMASGSCPKNATCNPPPPMAVECPLEADSGLSDAAPPPNVPKPPKGREAWLLTKPYLSVSVWGCSFGSRTYCPPVGSKAHCDHQNYATLSCQHDELPDAGGYQGRTKLKNGHVMPKPPAGSEGHYYIEGFTYTDVWGRCRQVDERWCDEGKCPPDEGRFCDAEKHDSK